MVDVPSGAGSWLHDGLKHVDGYVEFAGQFAGATFSGGLYRFHDAVSGPRSLTMVTDYFPEYRGRIVPFGFDWLGRQFALDHKRLDGGEPLVLMLEPGTGEALEIPANFMQFHEDELINYTDAALASEAFSEWAAEHPESVPLAHDQCVGYKVPLFLGGEDGGENFEVSDLDVYWTVIAQLRQGMTAS